MTPRRVRVIESIETRTLGTDLLGVQRRAAYGKWMRLALAGSLLAASLAFSSFAAAEEPPPPPSPPPPPPASEPPPPPRPWGPGPGFHGGPPPPRVDRVAVTVDSTNPEKDVVIERRIKTEEMYGRTLFVIPQVSKTETWEQVCVAPCRVELDRAATYRVAGENSVTRSGQFTLPPGTDQVKLEVQPGNFWWHALSKQLIATGTAAAIVGGALLTTAHTWDSKSDEKHVRNAGIITAAIGLGLLAAGIPIAILTQTHVKANERKVSAAPPPPKLTLNGLVF